MIDETKKYILRFEEVSYKDVLLVGGKNASLGEMIRELSSKGVNIPGGFALTTSAYWYFLKENKIDQKLKEIFKEFDPESIKSLQRTGRRARLLFLKARFPQDLKREIFLVYKNLGQKYTKDCAVAVRSSGVAEDAPTASFAGQFETFLNVRGKEELLGAIKRCLASTFNDRVIAYREEKGLAHLEFALSVGVQKMVRSDLASSGVIFTLDTETGFKNVVLINSVWGIGEMIVKGKITPDEFYVFKPTLEKGFKSIIVKNLGRKTKKLVYSKEIGLKEVAVKRQEQLRFSLNDEEILILSKWAMIIEKHYGRPQDIEWAKDGKTGQLFIVQSRPETVHTPQKTTTYKEYKLKTSKLPILTGIAIGNKIGQGRTRVIPDVSKIAGFRRGEVLVTHMTDPDWVPIMRLASAIITDEGSKVCHAAIVSRELGIPCIVGAMNASMVLKNGQTVTVDCTQGLNGRVFSGKIPFEIKKYDLKKIPQIGTKVMVNIGVPDTAFKASFLPVDGVGLAREEFIVIEKIRVHPLALYHYKRLKARNLKFEIKKSKAQLDKIVVKIDEITVEYKDKKEYFIKELAEGIAQIAAAFYPREIIVRLADFKSNEYRNLIGGDLFEKEEVNPMLGFRGAARYLDKDFQPAFKMECQAIKRVREVFGLNNISIMVPFCRTLEEGEKVLELVKKFGLKRDRDNLKIYVMCEIPSNVVLAEDFLRIFDGMSIGSNDLTQLALGIDRDNAKMAVIFDERNRAVKEMIKKVISLCKVRKKYCGICGQAPSDYPDFAQFLVKQGIESISLDSDTVIKTIMNLSKKFPAKKKLVLTCPEQGRRDLSKESRELNKKGLDKGREKN